MTQKYPIGIQSFRKIRGGGYLYVDKTESIHSLVNSGQYYFLSRPRRFGKSLLVDTIEELFSGSRELFNGLWIENHWNWQEKSPVLHFNFTELDYEELGLSEALKVMIAQTAAKKGLKLTATGLKSQFKELIEKVSEEGKVVILIDEYDKPIIDYLDNIAKADEHREIMGNFYSVLKGADKYIRFLLITGVSRFSKMSIFSDLNNLEDISVGVNFNHLLGITQKELETYFKQELSRYPVEFNLDETGLLEEIRNWYNGYSWSGKETVYNPFSLLLFMKQREFRNYWFATGSPSFLVRGIRAKGEFDFENVSSSENQLGSFDPANMLSIPLLFQTGYLTIKSFNLVTRTYQLGYPNQEVKDSLLDNLLSTYRGVYPADSTEETGDLLLAIKANDVPGMIHALNAVIASIPYDHWKADTESIFHIITFLTFKKVGVDVHTEVHTSKGRCDVLVTTSQFIYVMELKRDGTAREALDQILGKQYLQPYGADQRKKIAIGISFSSEKREVAEYLVKEL